MLRFSSTFLFKANSTILAIGIFILEPKDSIAQVYSLILPDSTLTQLRSIDNLTTFSKHVTDLVAIQHMYRKGRLVSECLVINGELNGPMFKYDTTGMLTSIVNYVEGHLHGYNTEFYPNGMLRSYGLLQFVQGNPMFVTDSIRDPATGDFSFVVSGTEGDSVRDGTWRYYSVSGALVREETWIRGRLVD